MGLQQTTSIEAKDQIAPFSIEWQGKLAQASANQAQFALFLALNDSKTSFPLRFVTAKADEIDHLEQALHALNFYPVAATTISEAQLDNVNRQSTLRAQGDFAQAWLEECCNPAPIHFRDDKHFIDEQVIANCRYVTQQAHNANTQHSPLPPESENTVDIDATLLSEIVPASQSML